jgi:DNA-binding response OmpR family regulator
MNRIALIEDNYNLIDNLTKLLISKDFEVSVFKTVEETEAGIEKYNPTAIICDLNLPDGNGEEIIKKLRKNRSFDFIPIIILTGSSDLNTDKLLSYGVYKILLKPLPINSLLIILNKALMKREQHLNNNKLSKTIKRILNIKNIVN